MPTLRILKYKYATDDVPGVDGVLLGNNSNVYRRQEAAASSFLISQNQNVIPETHINIPCQVGGVAKVFMSTCNSSPARQQHQADGKSWSMIPRDENENEYEDENDMVGGRAIAAVEPIGDQHYDVHTNPTTAYCNDADADSVISEEKRELIDADISLEPTCYYGCSSIVATSNDEETGFPLLPRHESPTDIEKRHEKPKQNLSEAEIKRLDDIGFKRVSSRRRKHLEIFDKHYTELLKFKKEFGHCRVPLKKSKDAEYFSLGNWVCKMRMAHNAIQKGEKPEQNLSEAEIKRLDDIGFDWVLSSITKHLEIFDKHYTELLKFKEEFGHCRVPRRRSKGAEYFSLGNWVFKLRTSYKAIQKGEKPRMFLSKAEIKRLDDIGFDWVFSRRTKHLHTFDKHYANLLKFKEEFGHCRVPLQKSKDAEYFSLGHWVNNMRTSHKAIQRNEKPKQHLSEAEIKRLDDIGFEWVLRPSAVQTFDGRYTELLKFKEEFGHCCVPRTRSKGAEYFSLGNWVNNVRIAQKAIQKGEKPNLNLSEAEIKRLDDIGFEWVPSRKTTFLHVFDKHYTNLLKFKAEYGHCRVSRTKSKDAEYFSLGHWVRNMRTSYNAIQKGEKQNQNLSDVEIKRLDDIGFEWVPSLQTFDDRCTDLLKFEEEFGHCRAPQTRNTKDEK